MCFNVVFLKAMLIFISIRNFNIPCFRHAVMLIVYFIYLSILSGCCYSKPLLVPGGRAFVWPAIQSVQRISLNTMTLQVESPTVYTSQGVPISVTGIAQVKYAFTYYNKTVIRTESNRIRT